MSIFILCISFIALIVSIRIKHKLDSKLEDGRRQIEKGEKEYQEKFSKWYNRLFGKKKFLEGKHALEIGKAKYANLAW